MIRWYVHFFFLMRYVRCEILNSTSPLDILCFALGNPIERSFCQNKANTKCLLQRASLPQNENKLKIHPCTTNAVAKVDMNILFNHKKSKCVVKSDKRIANKIWLATMVKNDAQSTIEWLVWHFLLGVDHVLFYDNESTDNIKEALGPFIEKGLVEYIYHPGIGAQAAAYTDALRRAKDSSVVWLAAIDVDEYIAPILDKCIPDFLARFVNQGNVGGVRLNWQYVNSLGKLWRWDNAVLDQTVLDRTGFYTGRADSHVKTIARVDRTVSFIDAHYAVHTKGAVAISPDNGRKGTYHFTNPPQTKTAVMLHMHVRTLEEWIIKRLRGRGSVKVNQCPYCNATLETLTAEWLCLNAGGFGIPDKDSHAKCKDNNKVPSFLQAPLNWDKKLYNGLAKVMKRQGKMMHAVLLLPIETVPMITLPDEPEDLLNHNSTLKTVERANITA